MAGEQVRGIEVGSFDAGFCDTIVFIISHEGHFAMLAREKMTNLLQGDYISHFSTFCSLVASNYGRMKKKAERLGIERPYLNEALILTAVKLTRTFFRKNNLKFLTFDEMYIAPKDAETEHTQAVRDMARKQKESKGEAIARLNQIVEMMRGSSDIGAMAEAYDEGYRLLGRDNCPFPRPERPDYDKSETARMWKREPL